MTNRYMYTNITDAENTFLHKYYNGYFSANFLTHTIWYFAVYFMSLNIVMELIPFVSPTVDIIYVHT